MKTKPDDSAYPLQGFELGLTKREAFAMAAMQGLLASPSFWSESEFRTSGYAVKHADALIAALNEVTE